MFFLQNQGQIWLGTRLSLQEGTRRSFVRWCATALPESGLSFPVPSGTLHFGLTAEKLFEPHESLPWNPLIARVFHRRGIIESWGRGTLKMADLTQKAGLPRPEIEEQAGCVMVRFRPSKYIPPRQVKQDLTERQRAILEVLASRGVLPRKEIVAALNEPELAIRDDLERLRSLGLVDATGHGRGAVWLLRDG